MIIKTDYLFEDITNKAALWMPDENLDNDVLVHYVDVAIENNIHKMSVPVGIAGRIWPWIEHNNINLLTRFDFSDFLLDDFDLSISNLASKISSEFRHGSGGIQMFLSKSNIDTFVQGIVPIREDLFFDKELSVALKIDDIDAYEWPKVFEKINHLCVNSLLIYSNEENFNAKSDFVGRVFAILESWNTDANIHIMFGKNMLRIGQTIRLIKKMQPNLEEKTIVFVEN